MHRIWDNVKKWGPLTALIVSANWWLPWVEEYYMGQMMSEFKLILREETHYAHAQKNVLDDAVLLQVIRVTVAKQSIHKVEFIERLIEGKDFSDPRTRRRIEADIRNELVRQSAIYVTFLNNFSNPRIGKVGDHIAKTFPMDKFLKEVFKLVLDNGINVSHIGDDVMRYMLKTQEEFFNQMWHEMKRRQ